MLAKHKLGLYVSIIALLAGCNTATPSTSVAATTNTVVPTFTQIAALPTTEPPTATSTTTPTVTPTSTRTPTSTSTSTPTVAFTPAPTATPRNTATPKPTRVAATTTATNAPASGVVVPPPEVFQFDIGGFIKYLDQAHLRYQQLSGMIGLATRQSGSCREFNEYYNGVLGLVEFKDAPEPWAAMVTEYNNFRTQVLVVIDPVTQVCKGRGGSLDSDTVRKMLSLLDQAQSRMYQMLQQAKAMTK